MSYLTEKYGSNSAAKAATSAKGSSVKGSYVDYSSGTKKTTGSVSSVVNAQKNNTTAQNKAKNATNNVSSKSYNTTYTNNGGTKKQSGGDDKNKVQNQAVNTNVNTTASNEIGGSPLWEDTVDERDYYDYESKWNDAMSEVQSQLAAQQAAQAAAIQAGVDQAVNSLNAQKETTAQDYADAYRQLYINQMNAQKNINQQLAAQGQTGGAAESTLLGLSTNYEDNLRQGKTAEQNALSALEQAITDAKLSGSIETANNTATTAQQLANAYLSGYQNLINTAYQYDALKSSDDSNNRNYAYQLALSMLNSGSMPSDAVLSTAGISKSDASTILANAQASTAAKATGTGKTSNSNNSNNKTTDYTVSNYGQYWTKANADNASTAKSYALKAYSETGNPEAAYTSLDNYFTQGAIDRATYKSLQSYLDTYFGK